MKAEDGRMKAENREARRFCFSNPNFSPISPISAPFSDATCGGITPLPIPTKSCNNGRFDIVPQMPPVGTRQEVHLEEKVEENFVAVRIRLKKMGRTHRPFYRVCAFDHHAPRDGRALEELGTYDTSLHNTDARAVLNAERIDYWLSVGAQPTEKVAILIKKYGKDGTHLDQQKVALEELATPKAIPAPGAPASLPKKPEEPKSEDAGSSEAGSPEKPTEGKAPTPETGEVASAAGEAPKDAASEEKSEGKPEKKSEEKSEEKPTKEEAPKAEAPKEEAPAVEAQKPKAQKSKD